MNPISLSRRRFIASAGAWLGSAATGLAAARSQTRTISILHTTDLHGHILPTRNYAGVENLGGFARCATCIRGWRRENEHSLLVDLGDVYQGTPESHENRGNLMISLFNHLGYDAWALGNHDFDWGPEALERNLTISKPPVLTANIRVSGKRPGTLDGAWKSVLPWTMREVGGFRIALIGLVTPGLPFWLAPETLGSVTVEHPLESLLRSVREARAARADAIIALTHMGWRFQDDFANPLREILRQAPEVDVLLAGHTHQERPSWQTGNVLCTQAGYHGIQCGRVDLTFDLESRKLISREAGTRLMDDSFEPDPAVLELAQPAIRNASDHLARKLGTVTVPIRSGGAGNPLASFFCEAFAEALKRNGTPVDGVFHGTFGTGDLPAGDITVADCWKLLPYENLLVTASLSSRELIEIIKEERSIRKSDRILWPFELKLDPAGNLLRFLHRGKPVPSDARFTIAFNSYDAQSGGRSMLRLREILSQPSARRAQSSIDTRGALVEGILNRGEIP